jgi:V8-like Glu-specific endopeptidase
VDRISGTHRTPTGRRQYARWLFATVAALTAAATAVVPGTAALAAPTRTAHLQSSPVTALLRASAAQQRATLAYWTPQRMAEAKSFDILSDGHAGPATAPTADPYAGKPEMLPGGLPADASVVDSAAFLDRPSATASSIFEKVPVTLTTTYPYRTNGKIFFTLNGGLGQCSGTSVRSYQGSRDEDEVWTAGHCLVNSEGQADRIHATNIEFVPAYDGSAGTFTARYPFGAFAYAAGMTTTAWLDNADHSEDEAALVVGRNSAGQTLGQAVGEEGFAWNQSETEYFTAFGYPAASPFTGTSMYEDNALTDMTYPSSGGAGRPPIGIINPMTPGSSGGAWNIDWSTTKAGYIDGHNDFTSSLYHGVMFSPYQDSLANIVRCFGASSC